jgi:hypothetical protein
MDTYKGTERRKDFITRHAIDLIQTEPNRALDLFRAACEMDEAETLSAIPSAPIARPRFTVRAALCLGLVFTGLPFIMLANIAHGPVMPRTLFGFRVPKKFSKAVR